MLKSILFLCAAISALLMSGCASGPRVSRATEYLGSDGRVFSAAEPTEFDNVSYWDGDGVSGSPSIRIALSEQRAYFYKGGELVGVSTVSTGREGFDTPAGTYKIIQKNRHHKSNLYGNYVDSVTREVVQKDVDVKKDPKPPGTVFDGASMPYFMRIKGGYGMHAGFLPGYPASHGCIRMPEFMASNFFANAPLGTPVRITN
jgi:hypothetical protein